MHYFVNYKFIIAMVMLICEFGSSNSTRPLCDIRVWYINLITDGVFSTGMNNKQLTLKTSIETLVKRNSNSEETRKTDCHLLQMYEDMLRETFDYKPSTSVMDMLINEDTVDTNTNAGVDETGKDDIPQEFNQKATKEESKKLNEDLVADYNAVPEDKDDVQEEQKENETNDIAKTSSKSDNRANDSAAEETDYIIDSQEALQYDKASAADISDENDITLEKDISIIETDESSDDSTTAENSADDRNEMKVSKRQNDEDDTEDLHKTMDSDTDPSEINSDDTEMFDSYNAEDGTNVEDEIDSEINSDDSEIGEEESEEITSDDTNESFPETLEEDLQIYSDDTQLGSDDSEMHLEETHSDAEDNASPPGSVPRSADTGDYLEHENNTDKAELFQNDVSIVASHTADPTQEVKNVPTYSMNNRSRITSKCYRNRFCTRKCYLVHSVRYCIPGDEHDIKNGTMLKNIDKNESQTTETNTNNGLGAIPGKKDIPFKNNKIEEITVNQTLKNELNITDKTGSETVTSHFPKQNLTVQESKEVTDTLRLENTDPSRNLQSFPYEKLDKLVTQRTSEYGQKIQSLELMILKLENQLLVEKLNKQNHSSTMTRLENMILKLENDLLRMYKNYESLKEDTEEVNKKQSKYLEIAQKQEQRLSKYPALPNESAENMELISKHQIIISELTKTINNHTTTLNHMKMKSDYLEQQNHILHEMIANQTVFMTQVLQNVKDLTEQNSKQMHKVNVLKQKLSDMHSSDKFLEMSKISNLLKRSGKFISDLDSLASHEKISMNDINISDNHKSDLNSYQVFAHKWCQLGSFKNNSCLYNKVWRTSGCVPFKEIIWGDCLQNLNIETNEGIQISTDYPTLPVLSSGEDSAANKTATLNIDNKKEVELPKVWAGIKDNAKGLHVSNGNVKQHQSPTVSIGEDSQAETPTASVGKDYQAKFQTKPVSKNLKTDNQYNKVQPPSVSNLQDYVIDNVFKYKRQAGFQQPILNTKIEDMNPHIMEVYDIEETSMLPKDTPISGRHMEINPENITEDTKKQSTEQSDNAKLDKNDKREFKQPDDLENIQRGETLENGNAQQPTFSNTQTATSVQAEVKVTHAKTKESDSESADFVQTDSKQSEYAETDILQDDSRLDLEFKNTESQTDIHYNSNQAGIKQGETLHDDPKPTESKQDSIIQTNINQQETKKSNAGTDNVEFIQSNSTQTVSKQDSTGEPEAQNTGNEQSKSQNITPDHTSAKSESIKKSTSQENETKPDIYKPNDTGKEEYDQAETEQTGLSQQNTKTAEFEQGDTKTFDSKQSDIKHTGSEHADTKKTDSIQSGTRQSESENVVMEQTEFQDAGTKQVGASNSDKKRNGSDHEDDKKVVAEKADKQMTHNQHDDTSQNDSDNKQKDSKQSDNKNTAAEKTDIKLAQSLQTNTQKPDANDKEHNQPKSDTISAENIKPKTNKTEDNAHSPPVNKTKETINQTKDKNEQKKEIPEKKKPTPRKKPMYLDTEKQTDPKDCYDHYTSGKLKDGVYKIKPGRSTKMIQVFCDMKQGGWTLIQRRQDGTTNFFQDWDSYKKGFGGIYGEHWLGNDNIHKLTNQDYYHLRVELRDWSKNMRYAEYNYILVDNEEAGYKLHIDGYSGDAGDGLSKHNGMKFSTKDVDNDKVVKEFGGSCANRFHGANWYFKCYASNLNGKYYRSGKIPEKMFDGITWKPWTGPNYSLKSVQMKIRPASVNH